ncbi:MAG: nitrilase-related carbon-nitrogen hydrolase [Succinivibrio sp.]
MTNIINIQFQSLPGDFMANIGTLKRMLSESKCRNPDLIVIPEFFASSIDYVGMAPGEDGGEIIAELRQIARDYCSNVIAGSVVRYRSDGRLYNTSFAIDRNGRILRTYDKRQLNMNR